MEYDSQNFDGLVCENKEIRSREFNDCIFTGCLFAKTIFRKCKFCDCTFKECDLSLIGVNGCSFTNTKFESSKVMGVNWTEAMWPKGKFLNTVDFSDCLISHSTFIGLQLREITMKKCVARDMDFSDANLSKANCTHTDFADSRFSHTDLTEADFSGATNYYIDVTLNVIKKTRFSLPEAMSLLYSLDIVLTDPAAADPLHATMKHK